MQITQPKILQSARQCGAALVTTLLMVALITVTVTSMATKQQRTIQLAQNRQAQLQLRNLASAGEKFSMAVLRRDKQEKERSDSDSTEDFWAQSLPPVPIDGATIEGCVIDLGGKFNLNNLVDADGNPNNIEFEVFQRLLTALTIDSIKAAAVLDWIDSNIDVTGADGAEDDFYTGQTPSYRAANGPMVSPTELLLVKGFRVTDEGGLDDYDVLLPHISTLPLGTVINVNTASSAVLASLAPHMVAIADEVRVVDDEYWQEFPGCPEGGGLLDSLINAEDDGSGDAGGADPVDPNGNVEEEDEGGLIYESDESIEQAFQNLENPDEGINEEIILGFKSDYYMTRVTVKRDDITLVQFTTLRRDNNGALEVIRRSRGGL